MFSGPFRPYSESTTQVRCVFEKLTRACFFQNCTRNHAKKVETGMSTTVNMVVPTAMNNLVTSSLLSNIVETMLNNIVGPTMLLTHDNNCSSIVQVTTLEQLGTFLRVYKGSPTLLSSSSNAK